MWLQKVRVCWFWAVEVDRFHRKLKKYGHSVFLFVCFTLECDFIQSETCLNFFFRILYNVGFICHTSPSNFCLFVCFLESLAVCIQVYGASVLKSVPVLKVVYSSIEQLSVLSLSFLECFIRLWCCLRYWKKATAAILYHKISNKSGHSEKIQLLVFFMLLMFLVSVVVLQAICRL